jgi:UDP-3-O-[3-hydroxymyristoyl] N-acetylglucosamine deacetylase
MIIRGTGLHRGEPAHVELLRSAGPVRLRAGGVEATLDALVADGARRSTTVSTTDGRLRIAMVEHLFAALGAARIREGLVVSVEGPELPLVDGGALLWLDALAGMNLPPSPPSLVVVRSGEVAIGTSVYGFEPPRHADEVTVEVVVDFGDDRLERRAVWTGDQDDFRERIAPARTFGFARELGELACAGLARHVEPESVVVVDDERILARGAPFAADEPARHKLLDLVGDLYVHGGPPAGVVRAVRPGHAATHAAVREALGRGYLCST